MACGLPAIRSLAASVGGWAPCPRITHSQVRSGWCSRVIIVLILEPLELIAKRLDLFSDGLQTVIRRRLVPSASRALCTPTLARCTYYPELLVDLSRARNDVVAERANTADDDAKEMLVVHWTHTLTWLVTIALDLYPGSI